MELTESQRGELQALFDILDERMSKAEVTKQAALHSIKSSVQGMEQDTTAVSASNPMAQESLKVGRGDSVPCMLYTAHCMEHPMIRKYVNLRFCPCIRASTTCAPR